MTSPLLPRLRLAFLLLAVVAAPAWAASSASSAASDSLATSVGSVSDSLRGSSNASSPGKRTAAGEFRIVAIADVAQRPGRVSLALEPVAGNPNPAFTLELPQQTAQRAALAVGAAIVAKPRPYGVEFATVRDRQAFYLVLEDAWFHDLPSRPVTL